MEEGEFRSFLSREEERYAGDFSKLRRFISPRRQLIEIETRLDELERLSDDEAAGGLLDLLSDAEETAKLLIRTGYGEEAYSFTMRLYDRLSPLDAGEKEDVLSMWARLYAIFLRLSFFIDEDEYLDRLHAGFRRLVDRQNSN